MSETTEYFEFNICCEEGKDFTSIAESYGPAITKVSIVSKRPQWAEKSHHNLKVGTMWAGNGEYDTQVNFCPFCGDAAPIKIICSKKLSK